MSRKLKEIPATDNSLVLRTDFSDDRAWDSLCKAIVEPQTGDLFAARVECVSDTHYESATVEKLLALDQSGASRRFMFVADTLALSDPEHPILVIDLDKEFGQFGRTFRVIPSEAWSVENNLSIANMDFYEFADSADPDGIFRGFPSA
jgi:Domain of unknown function (DUF6924)